MHSLTVRGVDFSFNSVTGHYAAGGGAFRNNNSSNLTLTLCRFYGNSVTLVNPENGNEFYFRLTGGTGFFNLQNPDVGQPVSPTDATNNWWGCDGDPGTGTCQTVKNFTAQGYTAETNTTPRIDLVITASPSSINGGGTSTLTADFSKNTAGATINPTVMNGKTVTFGSDSLGSVNPATAIVANLRATSTYTAGGSGGTSTVSAQMDGAPAATTQIGVTATPTPTPTPTPPNSPPGVTKDNAAVSGNEGSNVVNSGTFSDPDGQTVVISADLGQVNQTGTSSGTWSWSYTPPDNGTFTVTITATDSLNAASYHQLYPDGEQRRADGAGDGREHGERRHGLFVVGRHHRRARDGYPHRLQHRLGRRRHQRVHGRTVELGGGKLQPHLCRRRRGGTARTITVSATDEDGTFTLGTKALTVNNVAPTIALTGDSSVSLQANYTLNLGAITDSGSDTVTAYSIDWGDGTATENFSGNPSGGSKSHTYAASGSRTIVVALTDEDGTFANAGTKTFRSRLVPRSRRTPAAVIQSASLALRVSSTPFNIARIGCTIGRRSGWPRPTRTECASLSTTRRSGPRSDSTARSFRSGVRRQKCRLPVSTGDGAVRLTSGSPLQIRGPRSILL